MRSRKSFSVLLLGFGIAAAPFAVFAETWRSHFDSDGPSRPPGFFDFVVLGEAYPANWMVLADRNPPSAPNQVTQTFVSRPEGSIAVRRSAQRLVSGRERAGLVEENPFPGGDSCFG
jgi:hypothetical protein